MKQTFVEKINNLLLLLEDVDKYEINDYYVVMLIRDIMYEMTNNKQDLKEGMKIKTFLLENYIKFMEENPERLPIGLVAKNKTSNDNLIQSFRNELQEILIEFSKFNE